MANTSSTPIQYLADEDQYKLIKEAADRMGLSVASFSRMASLKMAGESK